MAQTSSYEEKVLEEAYSATPNYSVDYNDERFGKVESDKEQALTKNEQLYGDIIGDSDKYYKDVSDALQQQADKQAQIQQENTDFIIEKIEQQKEQAQKDYIKEQSGAYVDWQKQSNQYGVNAEKMASAGLWGTGYSESSQVAMYNQYQNRIAIAREALSQAKLNYDNGIKEAMLQNNAALAEIYGNLYVKQAELALEGALHTEQLKIDKLNRETEIDNIYYNRWQDVLNQINTENAMAEEARRFDKNIEFQAEQAELDRQHQIKLEDIRHEYDKKLAEINQQYKIAYLNAETKAEKELLDKKHAQDLEKLKKEQENKEKLLDKELANQKALIKYENDLKKQSVSITGGSSGGSSSSSGGSKGGSGTVGVKPTNVDYSKGQTATVNMQSVLALGYGPISASKLAELVASGKVTMYTKNGQIYYQRKVTTPSGLFKR